MADTPLRWHVEVRGRTPAELQDKIALQDNIAIQKGWRRVETGTELTDGAEHIVPLVYQKPPGLSGRVVFAVVILLTVVVGILAATGVLHR